MTSVRILLAGLALVLTMAVGTTAAHAQRRMLVLIDSTGSMSLPRTGDAVNPTRFHAAKALASQRVLEQDAVSVLSGVAVYTFHDDSAQARTAGFVDVNTALDAIDALDPIADVGGITPLAGSMCDAIDTLVANGGTTRILQVSSDGEENATPVTHHCFGPGSTSSTAPFSAGSWQNLVYNYAVGKVIVQIDLFNTAPISGLAARAAKAADPEAGVTAQARSRSTVMSPFAAAADDRPPTLEEFFGALAQATGGQLIVAHDEEALPVYADLNGDRCVDRSDAIAMARAFGQTVPLVDGRFDLDRDGKVGFADYATLLANRTPGCGAPDPYTPRAPFVCTGARRFVIDGQSIEDGGITVDARGACEIIIRNSLIVSGQNAIKIVGSAVIRVDNSILVGENAVVSATGASLLSAANTIFHGKKQVSGAFAYLDRGGNVWE
jgi:hypothetical protein